MRLWYRSPFPGTGKMPGTEAPRKAGAKTARPFGRFLFAAALLLIAACEAGNEPEVDLPRVEVEYAGCRAVRQGPVCGVEEDSNLTLWVGASPDAEIEILVGERSATTMDSVAVQGGRRFTVELLPDSDQVEVRVSKGDRIRLWTLRIEPMAPTPSWFDTARDEFLNGSADNARSILRTEMESASAAQRARAHGWLGRIDLATGAVESAHENLRAAIAEHRRRGILSATVDDGTVLAYSLIQDRRDFAAARAVLDSLSGDGEMAAEATYYLSYYRGLLATETGDARNALIHLEEAFRLAERLDLGALRRAAGQVLSRQLQRLGRRDESKALLLDLLEGAPADLPPCERGQLLNNLGWNRLLALEAGETSDSPLPELEQALRIFRQDCGYLQSETVNVLLNLALTHLHEGAVDRAVDRLQEARRQELGWEPRLRLWAVDLDARIALASGRTADSLERYQEMEEIAAALDAPLLVWQARVGRARALETEGDLSAAVEVLAAAEALLEGETFRIPIHGGRESFVARRAWAARRLVDLLVQQERLGEALAAVRRSRSRVLRNLGVFESLSRLDPDERAQWERTMKLYRSQRDRIDAEAAGDWQLPIDQLAQVRSRRLAELDELRRQLDRAFALVDRTGGASISSAGSPPPPPGELLLVYQQLSEGWFGFAQDEDGIEVRPTPCASILEEVSQVQLSDCLLGPFRQQIDRAETIRVLPIGALRKVDFHALDFGGDLLLARKRVVYGLDLATAVAHGSGDPPRALLVADPQMDLPAARREARIVGESLVRQSPGWSVQVLEGDAATSVDVRSRLAEVDLFHLAGHAVFAGPGGWDSVLPLADGSMLSVGDILALERAPKWIVLSACESGRSAIRMDGESLGLAQAFLSVGSLEAVATARPVDDEVAARIIRSLYRHWTPDSGLSEALRRAQLELRREVPDADWASFRSLVL